MFANIAKFTRRALISNESRHLDKSLEYRMFLAENPDFYKNNKFQAGSSTVKRGSSIEVGSQTLISGNRQFEQLAPMFNKADPYEI